MSTRDIIRALKDAEFRASLSEAEQAQLPAHPAGELDLAELEELELEAVAGVASRGSYRCTQRQSVCWCYA